MDSTKNSKPSSSKEDPLLLERISSARRKKRQFIVFLVIFFTLIIATIVAVLAVLKHQIDSESPAKNPNVAIRSACSFDYSYTGKGYCSRLLSPLLNSPKSDLTPTRIFSLSVATTLNAFANLPVPESTQLNCESLYNETLSRLRVVSAALPLQELGSVGLFCQPGHAGCSQGEVHLRDSLIKPRAASVDSDADPGLAFRELKGWLSGDDGYWVGACLDWVISPSDESGTSESKVREWAMYARSSISILRHADAITEMFNPATKSTLSSLVGSWEWDSAPTVILVLGFPYLYIIILYSILLRM